MKLRTIKKMIKLKKFQNYLKKKLNRICYKNLGKKEKKSIKNQEVDQNQEKIQEVIQIIQNKEEKNIDYNYLLI